MLEAINIGPLAIPTYPMMWLVALWVGTWLAAKEGQRRGISIDDIYNVALIGLLTAIIGGRIWYVTANWGIYRRDIWQAFLPRLAAIALPQTLVLIPLAVGIYCYRQKINPLRLIDSLAPGMALGLLISSLGAFLGSRRLGSVSDVPWAITQLGDSRHPVYLDQFLLFALMLIIVWQLRHSFAWPGAVFLLMVTLYGGVWLITEPFFAWSETTASGLRLIQLQAFGLTLVSLSGLAYFEHRYANRSQSSP